MLNWLERFWRWLEGDTYLPPQPRTRQHATRSPAPRSAVAPSVHYHEWEPSRACNVDHGRIHYFDMDTCKCACGDYWPHKARYN
jgi:hypothetical protein